MTFRSLRVTLGVLLAAGTMTTTAAAQSNDEVFPSLQWNFATPGARANGMGQTFIGMADDATAAVTNPAGLLSLTKPQVYAEYKNSRLTVDRLAAQNSFTTLQPTTTTRDISALSFFSVSAPVGSRLALGFSVHRFLDYHENFALDTRFLPNSSSVLFPVTGNADFTGTSYGASAAFMVMKGLRVGVTVATNRLVANSVATRTGVTVPGFGGPPPGVTDSQTSIDDHQTAMSATFGGLYRVANDKLSLGFSYTKSPRFTISENEIQNNSGTANATLQQTVGFPKPVELNVPDHFGFGIAFRPSSKLLVGADVVHTKYSSLSQSTTLVFFDTTLSTSDYKTPDVTEVHVGAEYAVYKIKGNPLLVRAGVFTNPSHLVTFTGTETSSDGAAAVEQATYNLLPRKNHTTGTVGAGLVVGPRLQIDVAYVGVGTLVVSTGVRF
jgi:long-chain fatty acid transport protein